MRAASAIASVFLFVALGACGGDDGLADAGADAGDAAPPDSAVEDSGTLEDAAVADTATDGGADADAMAPDTTVVRDTGTAGTEPPRIVSVSWVHGDPCTNRDRQVEITTVVEDPDTPPSGLVLSGSVTGCTGAIDGPISTVVCRGTSTTIGYLHVEDEGGRAVDEVWNLPYCVDGSFTF